MKANELRIGNIINNDGEEILVTSYTFYNIETDGEYFKDIPLTEEWLLKLGFEWKGLISKGQYLTITTPCGKALVYNDGFLKFVGVTIEVPIKHVHQLQNVYFALTGKELCQQ